MALRQYLPRVITLSSLSRATLLTGALSLGLGTAPLPARQEAPRLGRIEFPVSAGAEARREFELGVLWMHSFEYPRAAAAFQRAQRLEPGFAMAYWGEAMTHTHPVWNEQDREAARAVLVRLAPDPATRRARAATERERGYLDAVEALYGEGGKAQRDTLYAEAMERLVRAHPEDLEAKAFYALALIGLGQGVRDTATYRRAAAWADTVFAANPRHPGAAHYLIHAWDDPFHAHLGLAAARAYAGIAPDAAHAQHMTTHIFLALGMWEEVVAQNTIAMDLTARLPGHYTSWLHYALLQLGRHAEAERFLDEMRENMVAQRAPRQGILAWMRLAHVLATERWDDGPALWRIEVDGLPPVAQVPEVYFRGLEGYVTGSGPALDSAIARLAVIEAAAPGSAAPEVAVQRCVLEGWRHLANGREADAIRAVTAAAELQDALPLEFGPPAITHPPHEVLGLMLEVERSAEAVRAYRRSLALAPGRAASLLGLARAGLLAGDRAAVTEALDLLERHAAGADPAWKATLTLLRARVPATH